MVKTNSLNPIPVYGYHQHGNLQCNTPMSAAFCRMRTQEQTQAKYNKLHYPVDKSTEGFAMLRETKNDLNPLKLLNPIINYINYILGFNTREGMENNSDCQRLIKANHELHQLPSFSKSKVSPIDGNSNNKLVNELYLKQCFDSEYDGNVATSSVPDTLIQS
jgi:hypothetical protein